MDSRWWAVGGIAAVALLMAALWAYQVLRPEPSVAPPVQPPPVPVAPEPPETKPPPVPTPPPEPIQPPIAPEKPAEPPPAASPLPVPRSEQKANIQPSKRDLSRLPPRATEYGPILADRQRSLWADAPEPWTLAGMIEQETGPCPKGRQCWNARAELKTSREYGFGLGQITVAYNPDGSERFNEFNNLRRKYAALSEWRWEDRYDPGYQLAAIVEMVKALWGRVPPAATQEDRWAFTDASYNGGLGGLLQDRRLCANSPGCDQTRWFGHVETHSLKSKTPQKAYGGQSFYKINRDHVRHVLKLFRAKYQILWQS